MAQGMPPEGHGRHGAAPGLTDSGLVLYDPSNTERKVSRLDASPDATTSSSGLSQSLVFLWLWNEGFLNTHPTSASDAACARWWEGGKLLFQ